ncbi:MAG: T9SS type A sorting domain-containing protein [Armatimonadetes bacterium]|nr:T9SS type A sorting domain-containing protein [Armatimonadota bacterium]
MQTPISISTILLTIIFSSHSITAQDIQWKQLPGLYGGTVISVIQSPKGNLFAALSIGGVYRSIDNGDTWNLDGLNSNSSISAMVLDTVHQQLVVVNQAKIFRRKLGMNELWQQDSTTIIPITLCSSPQEGILYSLAANNRLYRSIHPDSPWVSVFFNSYSYIEQGPVIDPRNGTLYLSVTLNNNKSIVKSIDHGDTWTTVNDSVTRGTLSLLSGSNGELYGEAKTLLRSDNGGKDWNTITTGLPESVYHRLSMAPDGILYATNTKGEVYHSTDQGDTWKLVTPMPLPYPVGGIWFGRDGIMFAMTTTTDIGLVRSIDSGKSWHPIAGTMTGLHLQSVLRDKKNRLITATSRSLYISNDDGQTWDRSAVMYPKGNPLEVSSIATLADGMIAIATRTLGVLYSTDGVNGWELRNSGFRTPFEQIINDMFAFDNKTLYVTTNSGLFRSIDTVQTWQKIGFSGFAVQIMAASTSNVLYTATAIPGNTFWRSIDSGWSWDSVAAIARIEDIATLSDSIVFIATQHGLFRSEQQGEGLERCAISTSDTNFIAVAVNIHGPVLAATGNTIYRSTDRGQTWEPQSKGIEGRIRDITFDQEGRAMVTTWGGGIYISSKTTSAVPLSEHTTTSSTVTPNPCSAATVIAFELFHPSTISLRIFNNRGEYTNNLLNKVHYSRGSHSVLWNTAKVPEGIYFYELECDGRTETGRIIVRKEP